MMKDIDIEILLKEQLVRYTGNPVEALVPIAQGGSARRYYRLSDGAATYVGTFDPDPVEGKCFVRLARALREAGCEVPEVYAVSDDFRLYVQEDLGDSSMFSALTGKDASVIIEETLRRLIRIQKAPEGAWRDLCVSRPFSRRQVMWDLNYFKYEFLKPHEAVFDEDKLETDFERLSDRLTSIPDKFQGFMMRDCQSRNVMLTGRGPVFIDFQGGRKGPVLYDAVSLLWQARAGFSNEFRRKMLDFYVKEFCEGEEGNMAEMMSSLDILILFRTLQVLGAYGFRGLAQHKSHFLLSIPGALVNLRELLHDGVLDDYPEMKRCAEEITSDIPSIHTGCSGQLAVDIFSFSYKKGYPIDMSGNGGGFMFDCRALHNPGRYAEYHRLTGRDRAVADFLESRGETEPFLRNSWAMVDPAIERYLVRGFTHLQIGYGCTGGQHRSVYCAERTAAHVMTMFPEAKVSVIHMEHPENPKRP